MIPGGVIGRDMNDTETVTSNEKKPNLAAKVALLIGDDPEVKAALSVVLAPEGWTLEHSNTLDDALVLAKARQFDLIVTSRETSGNQDVEFLRRIRRVKPHTRIIILTDDCTPADVIASMREHAFGYLSKGFTIETLAETVRTVLLNAMEHGGHFDPEKYVEICYVRTRHMVMARIKDPGEGFTLEECRHAAIGNPPDDPIAHVIRRNDEGMRPGGYGVMLAKNLVDELVYGEKGNEVLLIKYLPELPAAERKS